MAKAERKELYNYVTTTTPYKEKLKSLDTGMIMIEVLIKNVIKDAMGDYVSAYCSAGCKVKEIFSNDDFHAVSDRIYEEKMEGVL